MMIALHKNGIVLALGGDIDLCNRESQGQRHGLDAQVRLPLARI